VIPLRNTEDSDGRGFLVRGAAPSWRAALDRRATGIWVGLIVVIASLVFFPKLGNQLLWQDEAQTALISQTILSGGVPLGHDGTNSFSQELGAEFGPDRIFKWHPWVAFYLLAGFFRIFGVSTFTARLPFALLGVGSAVLVYLLGRRLFRQRWVGAVAALLLVGSVPFLILAKQCRYYSPTIFLSLLGLYGYASGRFRRVLLPASILLFYTQNIYFATLWAAVLGHALLYQRSRLRELWLLSLLGFAACAPWFWFTRGVSYRDVYPGMLTISQFLEFGPPYLKQVIDYLFPPWVLLIPLATAVVCMLRKRSLAAECWLPGSGVGLLFLYGVFSLAVLCAFSVAPFFRYLAPLVPVCCLLTAVCLDPLASRSRMAMAACLCLVVLPGGLRGYLYEITHDFNGPVKGITRYLNRYGRPTDTVAVTYEDLPIKFYTRMRVIGGLTGEDLSPAKTADWVILRKHTICSKDEAVKRYLDENLHREGYLPVTLQAPDTPFENREDPALHRFRTDTTEDRVVILQRIARP
jgi:4-amino-4-deoxy-L-arabinose transferase-like glycosyltransferase